MNLPRPPPRWRHAYPPESLEKWAAPKKPGYQAVADVAEEDWIPLQAVARHLKLKCDQLVLGCKLGLYSLGMVTVPEYSTRFTRGGKRPCSCTLCRRVGRDKYHHISPKELRKLMRFFWEKKGERFVRKLGL